ncbi:hypothetical protein [Winogradskya consettensis]|uniref:hypothetical protein n=1 Tax=Winogradskya consettensis TaxID=113560 RepID=UPI001BB374F2|nr:hypothetical protein [Actinoplanes consettensis]
MPIVARRPIMISPPTAGDGCTGSAIATYVADRNADEASRRPSAGCVSFLPVASASVPMSLRMMIARSSRIADQKSCRPGAVKSFRSVTVAALTSLITRVGVAPERP